jgi:hypothetical protein
MRLRTARPESQASELTSASDPPRLCVRSSVLDLNLNPKLEETVVIWRESSPTSKRRTRTFAIAALAAGAVVGTTAFAAGAPAANNGKKVVKAAPPKQTIKKSMWGSPVMHDGRSIFPILKDLGVGLYSIQVRWEMIAPTVKPVNPTDPNDPAYQWPQYLTDAVNEATANGMKVQLLIMGTPPWANGGREWFWIPNQVSDWSDFVTAVTRKYPVANHYMIWGEPNRAPNFQPSTPAKRHTGKLNKAQAVAPRNYAILLDAAYAAIKAADPKDKVIGGNTYTAAGKDDINTYQWARYMKLPGGKRPRMDLWGHNPWGFTVPNFKAPPGRRGTVTFNDLQRLVKVLDKTFKRKKLKLFLAEWGVPSGFKDKDLGYGLSLKKANQWINTAFRLTRKYKRIYSLGWVHLLDNDRNSTGLLTQDGAIKPTYKTYRKAKP